MHNEFDGASVRITVHGIKLYRYSFLIKHNELSRPELAGVFNFRFHLALRYLKHDLEGDSHD